MSARWKLATVAALVVAASGLNAASALANSVTPMCTTDQSGTAPCINGWYQTAVQLEWSITPLAGSSSSLACKAAPIYNSDTPPTVVECDVAWPSPPNIEYPYTIRVEISNPTATATVARPPDSNGWYNHPVAVSFGGSSFSGIASCTPTTTYAGPDASNVSASGTCTDNAGKTAAAAASINYDATPPTITGATPSRPPDFNGYYTHPVSFAFAGTDSGSGIASCDTVTYAGPSSGSVVGGCRDQAGNSATSLVPVRYLQVLSPATSARTASVTTTPLLLHWKGVRRASYYNVQIYRGGKKVLSTWPSKTSLLVSSSWRFAGHRFHLKPGRYRWYVWPGYGSRTAARYGSMLVSATFRVTSHR